VLATYKNPWHQPAHREYGPAVYECQIAPVAYRGFLIYHRTPSVWDVVKDGVCVTQRAGPTGARQAIDLILVQNVDQVVIEHDIVAGAVARAT
jgi:hypothetical protein